MDKDTEQVNSAFDKLEAAENNPLLIIKKAFSHLPVILLIGSGIVINWILAVVFLIGHLSVDPLSSILIGLLFLVLLFPGAYLFAAYSYGQHALITEIYQEIVRPVLGNFIAKVLNQILKDDSTPMTSTNVQEAFEKESGSFLDKIPAFIKNRLAIFTVIKDVIKLATERYKTGTEGKEIAKSNIVNYIFELLDAKMGELAGASLKTFFIVGGINIVALFFIF